MLSRHLFKKSLSLATLGLTTTLSVAQAPKKEPDRTSNRGPEPGQVEIKFKLPEPPILTPEEALKAIKVPKGFKVELVASEPMVQAPVAMSWDDQGRLYVCEMRGYMHDVDALGEDQPIGRVSRLEDTDGDGKMDKAIPFVDNLIMPRSVTAFGDGVIVAVPPKLTWYRDTDGDGKVDKEEQLTEDFGSFGGQPEHMANSVTYGMDNWLNSAGYGARFRYQNGQFIKAPDQQVGQWGYTQDDWGRPFFNYNSDFLRTNLLPSSLYLKNSHISNRRALNHQVVKDQATWPVVPTPGVNRGYQEATKKADGTYTLGQLRKDGTLQTCTATCGPVIYRGDLFPEEFKGNAFIPEPAGYLVKRIILSEEDGVIQGKHAYQNSEFMTSTDERFRPVNAYNGPDGALYVVDMARGIIQHRFFLTHYLIANIKDRKLEQPVNLGRIWRVVPEGKTATPVKLPHDNTAIVPFLDHSNGFVRDIAQQTLVQRNAQEVIPQLVALAKDAKTPQGKVQTLSTLEGLNGISDELITTLLQDKDEKVRAFAVRFSSPAHAEQWIAMVEDPSTDVRVALAAKLASQDNEASKHAIAKLVKQSDHYLIRDAIGSALQGRELVFLKSLLSFPKEELDVFTKSGLIQLLAECVMTERLQPKIQELLEITNALVLGSQVQLAILNGIEGNPLPGGKPIKRKLLILKDTPKSLVALKANAKKNKALLKAISGAEKALAWEGKPGFTPPAPLRPLTVQEQARFDKGKTLYMICAACHQPNGQGMDGLAPPLADSEWVLGDPSVSTRIILHGIGGPIKVAGRNWNLQMPPLPIFNDEDLAALLTYIRREWENTADPVTPEEVAAVRAAHATRTQTWTAEELTPDLKIKKK